MSVDAEKKFPPPVGTGPGLEALFSPRSIAVIGASSGAGKLGAAAMSALADYAGQVWAVNPRADGEIAGRPAVKSLAEVGEPVDLVLFCVPSPAVPDAVADAVAAGARSGVIFAGGMAESGPDGELLQSRTLAAAREGGMRLLGPNTAGFINPARAVRATFVSGVKALRPGRLAIVAQSAGVSHTLNWLAHASDLGIHLSVGTGNAADVDTAAILDYLGDQGAAGVVIVHLEGTDHGERLAKAVARLTPTIPVVALKVGRSDVSEFARSHTGALTGSYDVARAALTEAGAVVVDSTQELVDAARALSEGRLAPSQSPGVAVVTAQAGPGLIMEDTLRGRGVRMPRLAANTTARLRELLPPTTFQANPVDTGRPDDNFGPVMKAVADDPEIDTLAVFALHEPGAFDIRSAFAEMDGSEVRVVFGTQGPGPEVTAETAVLKSLGVTCMATPERVAQTVHHLAVDAHAQWVAAQPSETFGVPALPPGPLDEDASKRVIAGLGLRSPDRQTCHTHSKALQAFHAIGPPVVVKVLASEIQHKTEAGGVHVDVHTEEDLRSALAAIDSIELSSGRPAYLVEEQIPDGAELLIGLVRDPSFGPVVVVGAGGTMAEAIADTVLGIAPVSKRRAHEMIGELRGQQLLDGFRGLPAVDRDELAEAVATISLLGLDESVAEIDVNPVRATDAGLIALDALILRS